MERMNRINSLLSFLEKEPEDPFLNYALGLEYAADLTTVADAETQFKIVLGIDENYIAAYYQLGQLFASLLRIPESLEYYSKGLEKARLVNDNKAVNEFNEAIFLLED